MAHVRQQIRQRIGAVLSSGVTLVGGRVYRSRVYPLDASKLPAITVLTGSETSNLMVMGSKTLDRTVSIFVDCYVSVKDTFDDDVDAIAVQVEEAIAGDFTVNGLAKTVILQSTEIDFSGEAETPIGVARLTYDVRYVTAIDNVETAN
jgi:hypothetical protein